MQEKKNQTNKHYTIEQTYKNQLNITNCMTNGFKGGHVIHHHSSPVLFYFLWIFFGLKHDTSFFLFHIWFLAICIIKYLTVRFDSQYMHSAHANIVHVTTISVSAVLDLEMHFITSYYLFFIFLVFLFRIKFYVSKLSGQVEYYLKFDSSKIFDNANDSKLWNIWNFILNCSSNCYGCWNFVQFFMFYKIIN